MFAPHVAQRQTKPGERPARGVDRANTIARGAGDHEAEPLPTPGRASMPRLSWGFDGIPLFPVDQPIRDLAPILSPAPARAGGIQMKLAIGRVDDPLEHQADRAADAVMNMPDRPAAAAPVSNISSGSPTLQRLCQGCEENEHDGDSDVDDPGAAGMELEGDAASQFQSLQGSGAPLSKSRHAFFESRFGHDFGHVRVHTDSRAATLAHSVNARAFTLGNHIVFGAGEYSPGTSDGDRILAHELAHVVQQGRSQPFIQRLSITRTALTTGTCGQRNAQWRFSLGAAAAAAGYLVQKVNVYEFIGTCPDVVIGPPAPRSEYWEAWPVAAGATIHPRTAALGRTDLSIRPSSPNKNGSEQSAGEVKFFARTVTGDLGDFGVAPSDPSSSWGPGTVPRSGAVPSTPTKPAWWDSTPVEGPANRQVSSQFNCCDADPTKNTSTVTATP